MDLLYARKVHDRSPKLIVFNFFLEGGEREREGYWFTTFRKDLINDMLEMCLAETTGKCNTPQWLRLSTTYALVAETTGKCNTPQWLRLSTTYALVAETTGKCNTLQWLRLSTTYALVCV